MPKPDWSNSYWPIIKSLLSISWSANPCFWFSVFSTVSFFFKEVDSVFMLLSAVLHIGDLRFTALTDADTAFPSDLQLLERGQCPRYMTLVACVGEVRGGGVHLVYIVVIAPPILSPLEFCLAACQREVKVRQSPVWWAALSTKT